MFRKNDVDTFEYTHADTFPDLIPIDESTLIDKCQLLDPIADDDDIDWKTDSDIVNPEMLDQIDVMIKRYRHGHRHRSSKVGGAAQPPPTSAPE
jgi:hypothetical protein